MNETPIRTERDGDFNCIALMDAASCFILAHSLAPVAEAEPTRTAVRRLLMEAKAHKQQLPKTLFIPSGQFATVLPTEAERQHVVVLRVPEDQLLVFISPARESFEKQLGGGSVP